MTYEVWATPTTARALWRWIYRDGTEPPEMAECDGMVRIDPLLTVPVDSLLDAGMLAMDAGYAAARFPELFTDEDLPAVTIRARRASAKERRP